MLRSALAVLALIAAAFGPAQAQSSFPTRPITMVVPLPAGGTADILARIAAEQIGKALGQTVVVENKPGGAGGLVGTEAVFRAEPDGYTILCAPQLTFSIARLLNSKITFDPGTMEPISVLARYPAIFLVRPDLPVKSVPELIAYAKTNPGKINYGSQGIGQIGHLTAIQLMHMAQVDITHIPFRGSAPATTALLGNQIDLLLDILPANKPHIEAGKMRLIGVASEKRLPFFPDVPTVAETLPGFEADTWMGIVAPPGTPKEITKKISDAIGNAFRTPEVKGRIEGLLVEPLGTTPDGMRALIDKSANRWTPLLKAANVKLD